MNYDNITTQLKMFVSDYPKLNNAITALENEDLAEAVEIIKSARVATKPGTTHSFELLQIIEPLIDGLNFQIEENLKRLINDGHNELGSVLIKVESEDDGKYTDAAIMMEKFDNFQLPRNNYEFDILSISNKLQVMALFYSDEE